MVPPGVHLQSASPPSRQDLSAAALAEADPVGSDDVSPSGELAPVRAESVLAPVRAESEQPAAAAERASHPIAPSELRIHLVKPAVALSCGSREPWPSNSSTRGCALRLRGGRLKSFQLGMRVNMGSRQVRAARAFGSERDATFELRIPPVPRGRPITERRVDRGPSREVRAPSISTRVPARDHRGAWSRGGCEVVRECRVATLRDQVHWLPAK